MALVIALSLLSASSVYAQPEAPDAEEVVAPTIDAGAVAEVADEGAPSDAGAAPAAAASEGDDAPAGAAVEVPDPTEDPAGFVSTLIDWWKGGLWMPFVGAILLGLAGGLRATSKWFGGARGTGFAIAAATILTGGGTMLVQKEVSAELIGMVMTAIVGAVALFRDPPQPKPQA